MNPAQAPAQHDDIAKVIGTRSGRLGPRARRVLTWSVVLVVLGGVGFGVTRLRGRPQPARYELAEVKRGDLRVTVTATGTLKALGAVEVGCEVSGRVVEVLVDENQHVTKGQLLARIDPTQLRAESVQTSAQIAVAQASIREADATRLEAKQALDRAEQQSEQGLIAQKDLEAARAAAARAEASWLSARANARLSAASATSAAWKLERTNIVSPIDGVVMTRSVEPGQTVQASFNTPVLFALAADLGKMELRVQIDEADVGRVKEGGSAEFHVDAYPDRSFASRVKKVRYEAESTDNVVTYEGVLEVDNAELLLRPGMTASATITADLREQALLVPNAALRFSPPSAAAGGGGPPGAPPRPAAAQPVLANLGKSQKVLYTLVSGQPAPLAVTPGATDGSFTELLGADLAPGTQVVVDMTEGGP